MPTDEQDLAVLDIMNTLRVLIEARRNGTADTIDSVAEEAAALHLNQALFSAYVASSDEDEALCCKPCTDCAACDNGENCKQIKQFMEATMESRLEFAKRLMLEHKLSSFDAVDKANDLYSNFLLAHIS